ncbi:MAG TPA: iron-containing alcohol dehydrogenase, partial [Candidatus Aminicenantes bacterium]|nr:iron-containing alcohol dehydrogenase [Candidatus Aminicenantes bacterium]
LGKEAAKYGSKILLVYGGGSIKRNMIFESVVRELEKYGLEYKELGGISPNPILQRVKEGVRLARELKTDLVLAVGGGSVIDTAKSIAAGVYATGDIWNMFLGREPITRALPVGTVLTLAATGSEANEHAVITNEGEKRKCAIHSELIIPKFSVMDPEYTFTVSPRQTAAGVSDIMAHLFEQYFSPDTEAVITDYLTEAVLRLCVEMGPRAFRDGRDMEARANLMWASTVALNGLMGLGKRTDWSVHKLSHELSARYGMVHGETFSILYPAWLRYVAESDRDNRMARLECFLFQASEGSSKGLVEKLEAFYRRLQLPVRLSERGIGTEQFEEMASSIIDLYGTIGAFRSLDYNDIVHIYRLAL